MNVDSSGLWNDSTAPSWWTPIPSPTNWTNQLLLAVATATNDTADAWDAVDKTTEDPHWSIGLVGMRQLNDGVGSAVPGTDVDANGTALVGGTGVNETDLPTFTKTRKVSGKFCTEWVTAQHALFQTANLFLAAGYLVPHSFRESAVLMRVCLSIGFFLALLWAALSLCAFDALCWNAAFCAANVAQACRQAIKLVPPTISPDLMDLYIKMFQPFKLSKQYFRDLTRDAELLELCTGDAYAIEDVTPMGARLSVLLKGRLRVTCEGMHLHFIGANQFIDSPEWDIAPDDAQGLFQVSIKAEEPCVYLCWPRKKLRQYLKTRPHIDVILHNMIGKDITYKLYSLNEKLSATTPGANDANKDTDPLRRCLSVDAVHTGTKGKVRSQWWRTNRGLMGPGFHLPARASSLASAGSSPARLRPLLAYGEDDEDTDDSGAPTNFRQGGVQNGGVNFETAL